MGTTVVACLVIDPKRVAIAHVGDSRAYLLRSGRLQAVTHDHTIVEELVTRGLLTPEEAERHPYKNVLSRNLGAKLDARIDLVELELKAGDRLLLCSDGLYGYASQEALQYLLGSGDAPDQVARDLIEMALRGGGGDNVSAIVIEAPQAASTSTLVRTSGAIAWWQHRHRFVQVAREQGLADNPICRGLSPEEALDLVALSVCEAVYHDLEKATGVNVWTFAQNLGGGWFQRSGDWGPLRVLVDALTLSARTVVEEIRIADATLGFHLDIAVSRALVVIELALGSLLADKLRAIDADLISLHAAAQDTLDTSIAQAAITPLPATPDPGLVDSGARFVEQPTLPFLRPDRPVTNAGISAELIDTIGKALTIARARTAPKDELARNILSALETITVDASGNFAAAVNAARELYGVRSVDAAGITPLFDALDQARIITAASVHQTAASPQLHAKVLAAICTAHQRLVGAMTGLVLETVAPITDRLRENQQHTLGLRDHVARAERKRAELESRVAAGADFSQPWDQRGNTEW
jgi:hypothetical protein